MVNNMEFKSLEIKDSTVDMDARTISGYSSTWDVDLGDDKIHKGAFAKTILEQLPRNKIKLMWRHSDVIGLTTELEEDDFGLKFKAKVSKTALGDEALELMRDNAVDEMSVGFTIPQGKSEIKEDGIRHIYEIRLMENSIFF